jgi:hypothetical protein
MGAFSPPATSTPTSNTVLSVSSSPPSSLLNCPTADHHHHHHLSHHLTLAERMSMSLLSHHAVRPMNLLCAPQPKVHHHLFIHHTILGIVAINCGIGLAKKVEKRSTNLQWTGLKKQQRTFSCFFWNFLKPKWATDFFTYLTQGRLGI